MTEPRPSRLRHEDLQRLRQIPRLLLAIKHTQGLISNNAPLIELADLPTTIAILTMRDHHIINPQEIHETPRQEETEGLQSLAGICSTVQPALSVLHDVLTIRIPLGTLYYQLRTLPNR